MGCGKSRVMRHLNSMGVFPLRCLLLHHTSYVTRHTSHVTRHASHVTRHTSHVTCHTSRVTRHTSHVNLHRTLSSHAASLVILSLSIPIFSELSCPNGQGTLPFARFFAILFARFFAHVTFDQVCQSESSQSWNMHKVPNA